MSFTKKLQISHLTIYLNVLPISFAPAIIFVHVPPNHTHIHMLYTWVFLVFIQLQWAGTEHLGGES